MKIKPGKIVVIILALALLFTGPLVQESSASHCAPAPCVDTADIGNKVIKKQHIGGNQILGKHIKKGVVTSKKIKDGGVKSVDVGFNYAGSNAKGGTATKAETAETLDGLDSSYFATAADLATLSDIVGLTVDGLAAQITGLEADLADAQNQIEDLESGVVPGLGDYVSVQNGDINEMSGPHILFTGANVHVRSGSGDTDDGDDGSVGFPRTGLGNLVLGYNELRNDGTDNRTGSHSLIVGGLNNFRSYGGMVAGYRNEISGEYASVSGGRGNTASGYATSVGGGYGHSPIGHHSSVSGGYDNKSYGEYSSIMGGISNDAFGDYSSVSGGAHNEATGYSASVSGGFLNTANGSYTSVSGGKSRTAGNTYDWVAGSLFEDD